MNSVLLSSERGAFDTILFDKINVEDFVPAIKIAIDEAKKNIDAIKKQAATFENIIEGLEFSSEKLDHVLTVYYNLFSAEASEKHQALATEVSRMSSNFSNDISLDADLFKKVKEVYDTRAKLKLSTEQAQLLNKTYKSFARNGALLSDDKKQELRKIDEELAPLSSKFSENVLKATNQFQMILKSKEDLAGLPESFLEASLAAAKEKSLDGHLVTLQAPSLIPFLTFSSNRELRKKIAIANSTKCTSGEFDNREIIKKTVELRHKRAKLLGYRSHADYILEERMAKNPDRVIAFLEDLLKASRSAADKDVQEVQDFAKKLDGLDSLQSWDFGYYSEKLKEDKYGFNEEDLRPYFPLDKAIEGVFMVASKLYNITFTENKKIVPYHKDVQVFEVHDKNTKDLIGIFYADFFPRETKKSGAWMTDYRVQHFVKGNKKIPQISIVCNFTKPTATKPSLLTFDEVQTLFHEFGHSLHGLLSNCQYPSIAGTNVYWDFVELPSQFMENFLYEKEVLDLFASHYTTKEKIPSELVEKLKRSSKFQSGYFCLRQLNFALLDMYWHSSEDGLKEDVIAYEKRVTEATRLLPAIPGASASCGFAHIFAGGYSAGYYSYKWAEVLDADAFEAFKEEGLFNPEVSGRFRENILSRGGSEDPMELYKRFRGREPDPKALLRRDGLSN
ncbi:MAG: M3 family metallopeptidase [Bdellovibrionales bacterium]|nr:M3 family metallopeptidase [Bdellovibrionales bacterium]